MRDAPAAEMWRLFFVQHENLLQMFEHALRKSSTLRQYFRSWGWVVAEVAICTPDAKPLAFMQALSEASLFSTFDLTLFAKLQLDQGSLIRQEDGLHSDEAFRGTPLPFSIVPDCTSLLQQLQLAAYQLLIPSRRGSRSRRAVTSL